MSFIRRNSILSNSRTIVRWNIEGDSRLSIASRSLHIRWNIRNESRNNSITGRRSSTRTNHIGSGDSESVAHSVCKSCYGDTRTGSSRCLSSTRSDGIEGNSRTIVSWSIEADRCLSIPSYCLYICWSIWSSSRSDSTTGS